MGGSQRALSSAKIAAAAEVYLASPIFISTLEEKTKSLVYIQIAQFHDLLDKARSVPHDTTDAMTGLCASFP